MGVQLRTTREGKVMGFDESTVRQLIECVKSHREIIGAIQARSGHPLSYAEMDIVRHGIDLEGAARSQARNAGITPPAPPGAKP